MDFDHIHLVHPLQHFHKVPNSSHPCSCPLFIFVYNPLSSLILSICAQVLLHSLKHGHLSWATSVKKTEFPIIATINCQQHLHHIWGHLCPFFIHPEMLTHVLRLKQDTRVFFYCSLCHSFQTGFLVALEGCDFGQDAVQGELRIGFCPMELGCTYAQPCQAFGCKFHSFKFKSSCSHSKYFFSAEPSPQSNIILLKKCFQLKQNYTIYALFSPFSKHLLCPLPQSQVDNFFLFYTLCTITINNILIAFSAVRLTKM